MSRRVLLDLVPTEYWVATDACLDLQTQGPMDMYLWTGQGGGGWGRPRGTPPPLRIHITGRGQGWAGDGGSTMPGLVAGLAVVVKFKLTEVNRVVAAGMANAEPMPRHTLAH